MAVLIQLRDAFKQYGDQVLLDHTNAVLVEGVKVGLVGRNGSGKSTLVRILAGAEPLEGGEVIRHPTLRVGYLRQHDPFEAGESALDFLMRDSGEPDWKCGEMAGRFELKGRYLEGPLAELSGGWQTRVKLAALLLHEPNLLLLDEPTNFLDLRTQILLEHFLSDFPHACVVVSHDRAFLRDTCSDTLDLTRGKLTMYSGNIDAFLDYREQRREHDRRVNASVIAKQKQLERFITKNRAKASTASQARSKVKQLERLRTVEIETDEPTARIRTPQVVPRQGPAARCTDLTIGYKIPDAEDKVVASQIELEIEHGQRVAVLGDNGQGKTTLLRTLVDSLPPLDGNVRWGYACDIGTYAQHVYTALPDQDTILEYLENRAGSEMTTQQLLDVAGSLLFREAHVHKKIAVLSGGERARVCLAGLLIGDHNILVLDEPGNHLDVESVESLANALMAFQGTVLFTSHDRHFLQRITTGVIEVRDGRAKHYQGGYEAYLYMVNKEIEAGERELRAQRTKLGKSSSKSRQKSAHKTHQVQRRLRKQINSLEDKIARLEEEKHNFEQRLLEQRDADEALRLHNEMESVADELSEAEKRWYELHEELGEDEL